MSTAADIRARPEDKAGHSFRFRNDTWADVTEAVKGQGSAASDYTEWVKEAIEARLGYVRCDRGRCGEPVPVEWGDLTGRPFDWWIGEAIAAVRGQRCRAHHPVTIGRNRAERAEAAATEIFGSAAAVPGVPASRSKKGRR